nr:putative ribonuclease H-like domain-containing protein [Tanacetum cinerariifolium]
MYYVSSTQPNKRQNTGRAYAAGNDDRRAYEGPRPLCTKLEPKKIYDALQDPSWEEGTDYDEVCAPVARIETIKLFLAYASFMGFIVYQMGVKSVFLYGTINEEVYVMQPPRFQDPEYPARVYKVDKAMYGLHQAPRARNFPLPKEECHCQKKRDATARNIALLSKIRRNCQSKKDDSYTNKHKTSRELCGAILKTFGGNEATKKTKKNLLKQQYGNFRAEGSETLEQMSDLDTMSLDDLYNHLKVYESEVQKKSEPNTQNMAFISSAKHSRGNDEVNTASVYTASSNVPTASANVATVSINQETACAYIASQSSGYQIKFKDINQIDEDDIKEMDINWNMAFLSMRADKFWKKTRKKISIQGSDVECIESLRKELDTLKKEKEVVDGKLAGLLTCSKDIDNLIKSQRSDKSKEGLGYTAVPPPTAQLYLSPKKDLSRTGLSECADDTVTDYSRPSPTIESSSKKDQNINPSASENVSSPITPKQFVKFVKASDSQSKSKTDEKETPKKPPVKYVEQYRKPNKKPNIRGNQRNWNNLKSHQLGPDFVMKKKACFKCGDFNHLAYECRKRVKRGTTRSQNNTYKSSSQRPVVHRPNRSPVRSMRPNMNCACLNRTSFNKSTHSYINRPFQRKSAVRSQYRAPWVSTVNRNFPPVNRKFSNGSRNFPTANKKFSTASRKFPTSSTKSPTADMEMKGKAVKPPACWTWKPSQNLSNKGPKNNNVSVMFKKYTYIDTQGRLKHMTCNISYLSDYEPFDGGYVSFGQGGCKITRKETIKTGKLEFENVYFVKDLKYNLFSVSQICANKNSVLFTDSECIVLGRDFKLLDDANILLRTPRQHNMYSIDLNNIVQHKDLTCLVAKASADECIGYNCRYLLKRRKVLVAPGMRKLYLSRNVDILCNR